jgi:hypothetical protein
VAGQRRVLERVKYFDSAILSAKEGNDKLRESIGRGPMAAGKIGSVELAAVRYCLRGGRLEDLDGEPSLLWKGRIAEQLYRNAGVYPAEGRVFSRFCEIYLEALQEIDLLAVWFNKGERAIVRRFCGSATLVQLRALEPYYHDSPWSEQMQGLRVLVVTPFVESVRAQYAKRRQVWADKPTVMPEFELFLLRAPFSSFLVAAEYTDWVAALESLKQQMSSCRFDVALVGAGAWSVPLVVHAKRLGAWAIHLGGATQTFFGIRGKRWETNDRVMAYRNAAWEHPAASETPVDAAAIEGGCYW